jgi:hypothetical protein
MAVLRVTTCGLRITRFFELGGIDVEIGGGWVVVLGLCAGVVMAGPGQHSVAVTLNYDFSVDNACSSSVTTGCVKQFNIYDTSGGGTPVK